MEPHPPSAVRRRYPPIERRASIDRDALVRAHLSQNRPVVFSTDSAAWRARWAPNALAARYGRCEVEAEEAGTVYVGERAHVMRPLAAMIDAVRAGDTTLRWKGVDLLARVPGMREDLTGSPPPNHLLLPERAHGLRDTLWIAPRGSTSHHRMGKR